MKLQLRKYREKEGLTLKQFAKQIKKATGTIQAWEVGDYFPNALVIWELCERFGVSPNEMLGWWEEHPRQNGDDLSDDEKELLTNYRSCFPKEKQNIFQMAEYQAMLDRKIEEMNSNGEYPKEMYEYATAEPDDPKYGTFEYPDDVDWEGYHSAGCSEEGFTEDEIKSATELARSSS